MLESDQTMARLHLQNCHGRKCEMGEGVDEILQETCRLRVRKVKDGNLKGEAGCRNGKSQTEPSHTVTLPLLSMAAESHLPMAAYSIFILLQPKSQRKRGPLAPTREAAAASQHRNLAKKN